MNWERSNRADAEMVPVADRHYNRQHVGAPQFAPPGRALVFRTPDLGALWITSWPFAQYVKHAWAGAWVNSCFRRESGPLASDLIREAVAATRYIWPEAPALGMITMVDASKVKHKRDPGRCYRKAGFRHVSYTKGGLWVYQLLPNEMPKAEAPIGELPLV